MIDYTLPLDQLPDPLPIEPLKKPFDVTITPPGSKSITCRAYVLAALAKGQSRIIRPLRALDTDLLLNALCTLGAEAKWVPGEGHEEQDVLITGVNGRFPRGGSVNLGDGGAPTRFMIAAACLAADPVVVDGSPRMRERPIAEGVDMLRQLGARIEYVEEEGRLPVRVVPSETFVGGEIDIGQTQSSQFVSAIMLVAPPLDIGLTLRFGKHAPTSESYLRITVDLMREWGIEVDGPKRGASFARSIVRLKPSAISDFDYVAEADASSAVYWALAGSIAAGNHMEIRGVAPDSKQPDIDILEALDDLGAIVCGDESGIDIEGTGGFRANDRERDEFDFSLMPDASMAFAVATTIQAYPIRITGLRTLRVKETDRIAALANELRKVGCTVETGEDWIEITPPAKRGSHGRDAGATSISKTPSTSISPGLCPGVSRGDDAHDQDATQPDPRAEPGAKGDDVIIETYNDHRMAMSFAILGLVRPGISICNPACVAKSYPTFWKDFAKLYQ